MGTVHMERVQSEAILAASQRYRAPMINFARRLIQTPSLPGDERAIAELMAQELRELAYDDVWIDRAGNVIGVVRGRGAGSSVQFNAHLDHVDIGDPALWPHPPYAGVIEGDTLFGRGASDVKGAMAAQVYLAPVLRDAGLQPDGDVYVVGVVLEEVGGFGSQFLAGTMPTSAAVLAEATNNELRRGHRGRVFVKVSFTGVSAHASAPERAINPHYAVARFLLQLERLPMRADTTFGTSTVAPTLIETDQRSGNVTPATIAVFLDWRNVPSETVEQIVATLRPLVAEVEREIPGIQGAMEIVGREVRTYTGMTATMPATMGFETPADHPVLLTAQATLESLVQRHIPVSTWTFATDGGHLAQHGITTIGFAPGEERFAHTIHDQISLSKMTEALAGNAALALALTAEARS